MNFPVETQIHQQANNRCAGAALPRIAVHNEDVLGVLLKPVFHSFYQLHQHMEWRGMVVLPIKCGNSAVKSFWLILLLRAVKYMVFLAVSLF